MRLKTWLIVIIVLFVGASAFAQDRIVKKNGEIIEAKVSVINQDNVVFKRFDNLEGPEYSIPKADVSRIKYPNGTEDVFESDNDKIGIKRHDMAGAPIDNHMHNEGGVPHNIVSLIPMAVTDGVGVGASIEHILDGKGVVNFYMPVMVTFQRSQNNDYYYNNGGYTGSATPTTYTMAYFMPGIKIYTNLNTRRKMKFSIGPSAVIGVGNGNPANENYTNPQNSYTTNSVSRFQLGVMGNIGLNFFPTNHVYFGIDYGLGFCLVNDYAGVSQGFNGIEQLSVKIGYRF